MSLSYFTYYVIILGGGVWAMMVLATWEGGGGGQNKSKVYCIKCSCTPKLIIACKCKSPNKFCFMKIRGGGVYNIQCIQWLYLAYGECKNLLFFPLAPPTWKSQVFGFLSPLKYELSIDLYFWKLLLNSFSTVWDFFTLSAASSTCDDFHNNFVFLLSGLNLNLKYGRRVQKFPGHVDQQVTNFLKLSS